MSERDMGLSALPDGWRRMMLEAIIQIEAHVKTECNYGESIEGGQVALNPDLSGMLRLRFLRSVGAVALILNMSDYRL